MCFKDRLWRACALVLMLGLQCQAHAGVMLGGTRIILGQKDREASISIRNTGAAPYVVQAWIDAGDGKSKTPLLVTPPLSRLDPGMENILRIMRVGGSLPADRESVFWLNVKEIPERSSEENVLQIAVRSRIKVFYRPDNLPGKAGESRAQLKWTIDAADANGHGAVLRIENPTAYAVTFTALSVDGGKQTINADMLLPFGSASYPLTGFDTPRAARIGFTTLNDYGGETSDEFVRVPAGPRPVVLTVEPTTPVPAVDLTQH